MRNEQLIALISFSICGCVASAIVAAVFFNDGFAAVGIALYCIASFATDKGKGER